MKIDKDYQLPHRYAKTYDLLSGKILDIGCHEGHLPIKAILNGFDVTGIDISPKFIKIAKQNAKDSGVEFNCFVKSVEDLPQDTKYDTIIMMDILEHLPSPIDAILEARKLLTPTGKMLITFPAGFAHYSNDHLNFFFLKEDFDRLTKLWCFHMLPFVFASTYKPIIIEELIKYLNMPNTYEMIDYGTKTPSYDFYIILKNGN